MSENYECHITMRGTPEYCKVVTEEIGWKFSSIAGDPVLGDDTFCYATKHFAKTKTLDEVKEQIKKAVEHLEKAKYLKVVREKIEYILYDSRWKITNEDLKYA